MGGSGIPVSRRTVLMRLATTGAFGVGNAIGLLRAALAADRIAPGVHSTRGSVLINGSEAKQGVPVAQGDTVATGANAQTTFVIGDNAFLQRQNTHVEFGAGDGGVGDSFFRVVTGAILGVFGRGEKRLVTGTAVIGIRGTGCYIEAEAERTYFCLCYGEAEVVPSADPSRREIVRATHHDRPLYIHAVSGDKCKVPATVINHTDVELTLLESLVGRKPPFAQPGRHSDYFRSGGY